MDNKFRFGIPIDIIKGTNSKGEETYLFKGLASTNEKDTQGETLFANRYDLSEFKQVNWNHKGKDNSDAILGEINKHHFTEKGLYVEGEIWSEMPMAKSTINLMKRKAKKGERLQLSVEGSVLQRGSEDKKNPAYYNILKAKLTGVAITPQPINKSTFAELIEKGVSDNSWKYSHEDELIIKSISEGKILSEDEIEKAMTAGHTTGTETINKETTVEGQKKEDLDGVEDECDCNKDSCKICANKKNKKVLSKSEIYESIFNYFCPINVSKAKQIYSLINKIAMTEKKSITEETIQKAFEILEMSTDNSENLNTDVINLIKSLKSDLTEEQVVNTLIKAGITEKITKAALVEIQKEKDNIDNLENTDEIQKSISSIRLMTENIKDDVNLKISSIGLILKSQSELIQSLISSNKDLLELNTKNNLIIEKISGTPIMKSALIGSKGLERFEKSDDEGLQVLKLSSLEDRKLIADTLWDLSGFNDGAGINGTGRYNENLLKASQEIEMLGTVSESKINLVVNEMKKQNIKIVK